MQHNSHNESQKENTCNTIHTRKHRNKIHATQFTQGNTEREYMQHKETQKENTCNTIHTRKQRKKKHETQFTQENKEEDITHSIGWRTET